MILNILVSNNAVNYSKLLFDLTLLMSLPYSTIGFYQIIAAFAGLTNIFKFGSSSFLVHQYSNKNNDRKKRIFYENVGLYLNINIIVFVLPFFSVFTYIYIKEFKVYWIIFSFLILIEVHFTNFLELLINAKGKFSLRNKINYFITLTNLVFIGLSITTSSLLILERCLVVNVVKIAFFYNIINYRLNWEWYRFGIKNLLLSSSSYFQSNIYKILNNNIFKIGIGLAAGTHFLGLVAPLLYYQNILVASIGGVTPYLIKKVHLKNTTELKIYNHYLNKALFLICLTLCFLTYITITILQKQTLYSFEWINQYDYRIFALCISCFELFKTKKSFYLVTNNFKKANTFEITLLAIKLLFIISLFLVEFSNSQFFLYYVLNYLIFISVCLVKN